MLVVPVQRDKIIDVSGSVFRVIAYTNYRDQGPAVYAKPEDSKTPVLIYFTDIEKINQTKVDYLPTMKVFRALGNIKRDYHLPQPGDTVTFFSQEMSTEDGQGSLTVVDLRLKNKNLGASKGIFVRTDDGPTFRLKDIMDIDSGSGEYLRFNRASFLSYYKEYIGV